MIQRLSSVLVRHRGFILDSLINGYNLVGSFAQGVTLEDEHDVVRDEVTGLHWVSTEVPYTIKQGDTLAHARWKCVGNLRGYEQGDARNFGFVNGMADAIDVIRAMLRSPFTHLYFPPRSRINVSDKIELRSDLTLRGNNSTLNYTGATLTKDMVASKLMRENAVFYTKDYSAVNKVMLENIHLSGFRILGNEVGVGINMRNVINWTIKDVYVEKCQVNGMNITNAHRGTLDTFNVRDCAPLNSAGYTSDDLEAWSDGVGIWFGCTDITVKNGTIEQKDITRGGRCGFVVDGYKTEEAVRESSNITVSSLYVYGYDRPVHTELCGSVTFTSCDFEYSSADGHPFIRAAAVVWNVLEKTVFINCKFISDYALLKTAGAKVSFIDCIMIRRGTNGTLFISGPEETGKINFVRTQISYTGGRVGAWNCSMSFDECHITSDTVNSKFDMGGESKPQELTMNNCTLYNVSIDAGLMKRWSNIRIYNTTIPVAEGAVAIECGLASLDISNLDTAGSISQTGGDYLRITGKEPTFARFPTHGNINVNGEWLLSAKPTGARPDGSGEWKRGDRVRIWDAVEEQPWGYQCVTPGKPGRWSALGTLPIGA